MPFFPSQVCEFFGPIVNAALLKLAIKSLTCVETNIWWRLLAVCSTLARSTIAKSSVQILQSFGKNAVWKSWKYLNHFLFPLSQSTGKFAISLFVYWVGRFPKRNCQSDFVSNNQKEESGTKILESRLHEQKKPVFCFHIHDELASYPRFAA